MQGAFAALIPCLQRAVREAGYTTPTPIQEACIAPLLAGRDLVGTAQTGTGKTAAFALPLLQRLTSAHRRPAPRMPRALILAPTRELTAQIGESMATYGRHTTLSHTTIFGGVSQYHQVKALSRGVDIVIATPGRLLDLMNQGFLSLNAIEVFVLDEVDRMLDMGFLPDIKRVLAKLPSHRQTLFFSATMPKTMEDLANTMVRHPERIAITPDQPTVSRITQKVMFVSKHNKAPLLVALFDSPDIAKAIVFTRQKHAANRVADKLHAAGVNGTAIHGNKSQAARTRALEGFKRGHYRVLVATDVAARGLDVDDITHVINYDLPTDAETYVHRIGRTARAGASGAAISFCSAEERSLLRDIERLLGQPVPTDTQHAFHCEESSRASHGTPPRHGVQGHRRPGTGSRPSHRPGHGGRPGMRPRSTRHPHPGH